MRRPLRITFPGVLYPRPSRGNAQAAIYADDADRRAFVDLLTQIVQRYHWLCHAYCLMDNHYHRASHPLRSIDVAWRQTPEARRAVL
jgi:putative transposase